MDKMKGALIGLALIDNAAPIRLPFNEDGYIGKIKPTHANSVSAVAIGSTEVGMKIHMAVKIEKEMEERIVGIVVNNKKGVDRKANMYMSPNPAKTDEENKLVAQRKGKTLGTSKAYGIKFQVKWSDIKKCLHTEYPHNNLRLLSIDGNVVEEWEVSVTSQAGEFFLNQQMVYKWTIYKNEEGGISSHDESLRTWPQMLRQLEQILGSKVNDLPAYDYNSPAITETQPETLAEGFGTVVWWNHAKGLGMIRTNKGVARVHWSKIVTPDNQKKFLTAGGRVTFRGLAEPVTSPNQPSNFGMEAVGVEQVS